MIANTADTLSRGMEILSQRMGIVDAERFIFLIKTEGFDYTKWQREYFDQMAPGEFNEEAVKYAKEHPFNGSAQKL